MCDVWKDFTKPQDEISLEVIKRLPQMFFVNVTGGEPFVRQDLEQIIDILHKKAKRIVISTNGFFTDRIVSLCKKYPDLGIRISIEGMEKTNDEIRKIPDGYKRTIETLHKLQDMGLKDIGFAMTVQDINAKDLLKLYQMSKEYGYEFATATLHNSHYFHKLDNKIEDKTLVINEFNKLIKELLKSKKPKDWFRAYFNYGLINYIKGNKRFLACEMGQDGFFVDPFGDVLACNGMNEKMSMGNLNRKNWDEIWNSEEAKQVRGMVKKCHKNCWMIGSAAPAIWHHPLRPILWVLKNKISSLFNLTR